MNKENDGRLLKVLSCRYREASATKTLKWSFEPCGTTLYYKKEGEGWQFSTDKINECAVPVRQGSAGKSTFTYINVRNIIDYDGDVSVYRQTEHTYLVKPAEQEQLMHRSLKKGRQEGDLMEKAGVFYISLNKTRHEFMFGEHQHARVHVVNDGTKAYMEVTPATMEDLGTFPMLNQVKTPYGGWQTLGLVPEYTYIQPLTPGQKILCPVSFARNNNTGMEPFMVWQKKDGTVILESHPVICDVCGKKISRFRDITVKGYTCGNCKKELPKIRQLVTQDDFDATLKNIRGVQSLLDSILKQD